MLLPVIAGLLVGALIGLKINPVLAVGTDLVFASITKWTSGLQHRRQNNVALRMVFWMALGSMPASFLMSTFVLTNLEDEASANFYLARILGVVLILVSLYTLARALDWIKVRDDIHWPPAWALTVIGALGGGLVGLTSVGSGTVIMASLLIFFSLPASQLVGLDVMHGALLTTVPAGVYAFGGLVDWQLVIWMLVGSIPGAWLGTRLVHRIPQRWVRGALSVFLIVAGVRLFL
jgi:uncharacterized membrane protein YfcA